MVSTSMKLCFSGLEWQLKVSCRLLMIVYYEDIWDYRVGFCIIIVQRPTYLSVICIIFYVLYFMYYHNSITIMGNYVEYTKLDEYHLAV